MCVCLTDLVGFIFNLQTYYRLRNQSGIYNAYWHQIYFIINTVGADNEYYFDMPYAPSMIITIFNIWNSFRQKLPYQSIETIVFAKPFFVRPQNTVNGVKWKKKKNQCRLSKRFRKLEVTNNVFGLWISVTEANDDMNIYKNNNTKATIIIPNAEQIIINTSLARTDTISTLALNDR